MNENSSDEIKTVYLLVGRLHHKEIRRYVLSSKTPNKKFRFLTIPLLTNFFTLRVFSMLLL